VNIYDIDNDNFEQFRQDLVVLEKDAERDKVYLYKNEHIIKVFVHKKLFSTSRLVDKAKQFERNACKLEQLQIPALTVDKVFYLQNPKRQCVLYPFVKGQTFYSVYVNELEEGRENLMKKFIDFFKLLHQNGVYFRSAHLDNILVREDGSLSLIDIGDIQFKARPLSVLEVFRNFKATLRRKQDFKIFLEYGIQRVLDYYFTAGQTPPLFLFLAKYTKKHPLHKLMFP